MKMNSVLSNDKPVIQSRTKLRTEKVNLYYGSFQALRNISLEIPEHAITAIIGPSGCGKSSLLRLFNRMNDLITGARVEGKVELDGIPIYDNTIDVVELRKRVGMVFQKPNPFPMSVFENVAFGPRRHGKNNRGELEDIVEMSLRRAALWDEVEDKLGQSALALSGG
jgi:phosphate transport system ATP-binding protein